MNGSDAGEATPEEREIKLAVGDDFAMPDTSGLLGVSAVDRGDETLRAVYWDSDDLGLARAGMGIRHRNGVWTYKGRSRREGDAVVREEVEMSAQGGAIPDEIRARVRRWLDPEHLHPIAELDTVRRQFDLAQGDHRVELVHDRVTVLDGTRPVARFAEVEVEFDAGCQDLADRVVDLLRSAGAVVDTTPKYLRALRALGFDPPEISA
jgi:inorganic triphosphatase YgiF